MNDCGCPNHCDEPIAPMSVAATTPEGPVLRDDGSQVYIDLCPREFVFAYAPKHPETWVPGTYIAARCTLCGTLQVLTTGSPSCLLCKGHLASMKEEKP